MELDQYPDHPEQNTSQPGRLLAEGLSLAGEQISLAADAALKAGGYSNGIEEYEAWERARELAAGLETPDTIAMVEEMAAREWIAQRAAVYSSYGESDPAEAESMARMLLVAEANGLSLTRRPEEIQVAEEIIDEMSRVLANKMPELIPGFKCVWLDASGIYLEAKQGNEIVEINILPVGDDIQQHTVTKEVMAAGDYDTASSDSFERYIELKQQLDQTNKSALVLTDVLRVEDNRDLVETIISSTANVLDWVLQCNQSGTILRENTPSR
jgi:hypothetical protein